MSEALKQQSFEDLYRQLRLLPDQVRAEILAGELVVSPRPRVRHSNASAEVTSELRGRYRRRKGEPPEGWWILPEPELHLHVGESTHVLSPDIAGWRRQRLPELPDTVMIDVAPDWVCEILSPSTTRMDKGIKARIYHDAGVTWRWIVDPAAQTLEAFRREGVFWVLIGTWGEDDVVAVEPFVEAELQLAYWWDGVEKKAEP